MRAGMDKLRDVAAADDLNLSCVGAPCRRVAGVGFAQAGPRYLRLVFIVTSSSGSFRRPGS